MTFVNVHPTYHVVVNLTQHEHKIYQEFRTSTSLDVCLSIENKLKNGDNKSFRWFGQNKLPTSTEALLLLSIYTNQKNSH